MNIPTSIFVMISVLAGGMAITIMVMIIGQKVEEQRRKDAMAFLRRKQPPKERRHNG